MGSSPMTGGCSRWSPRVCGRFIGSFGSDCMPRGCAIPFCANKKEPKSRWTHGPDPLFYYRGVLLRYDSQGLPVLRGFPGPVPGEAPARLHRNCALWVLFVYPLASDLSDCVPFRCRFGAVHYDFHRTTPCHRQGECPLQGTPPLTGR